MLIRLALKFLESYIYAVKGAHPRNNCSGGISNTRWQTPHILLEYQTPSDIVDRNMDNEQNTTFCNSVLVTLTETKWEINI